MPVIPNGFAQITAFFTGTGVPRGAACTIGLNPQDGLNPIDVLNELDEDFTTLHQALATSTVTLSLLRCKFGPNTTGPFAELPVGAAGTQGPNSAPPNVALLIEKVTGAGGRSGRGRMFWPGVPEGVVDTGGLIAGASLTQFQNACTAFLAAVQADGHELILLHSTPGPLPIVINALNVDPVVATQRDRLR